MRILITGNRGFVGTHLVKLLKGGYELYGADRKDGLDITSNDFLFSASKIKPDLIVHLAATCSTSKSLKDPVQDFKDNALGTLMVCEVARITGAKILYTSSCKVEPNPDLLRTPYGLSKYVGELYIQEYCGLYGIEYVINRPGTIYGPGQDASPESGWLSWFIKAKKENLPVVVSGTGRQTRDVLWVEDYVALLVDQVKNWKKYQGLTYDVGGGIENEVSLLQVLKFIGYRNYKFGPPRLGDVKHFVSDNKLLSFQGNWKPKVGWKEGIKKLL